MSQHADNLLPGSPLKRVLAITGHRRLHDPAAIATSLRSVLAELASGQLVLVSPLAEGADRLAAHEILGVPGGVLNAVLPLPAEDYEKDFTTPESLTEFRQLLSAATETLVLSRQPTRAEAYLAVGCHLVDNCDILIAVWDGRPAAGIGGTAEVVGYAKDCGKPMVLIDSNEPSRINRERLV